jgi:hypothetical protein
MKIIKATHTQALTEVSFIDQQNISDKLSQIKQGNKDITVYNDEYATLYDQYVKAGLSELTPPQIISRYVMSLNENFHREKMSILKVADKMINYYQKISVEPSYTQHSYNREREKNDNFPLDLPDAMQKMVNAELISRAVKPTNQNNKHLTIPHEGLAFNMIDSARRCGCASNCVFCHANSHCACKCEKLKSFMSNNKAEYQAAIQRKQHYQGKGGEKDNYGVRNATYRGGKSQGVQGRGGRSQSNSSQGKGGARGSYQQHKPNHYRGADTYRHSNDKGRNSSRGAKGTGRGHSYGNGFPTYHTTQSVDNNNTSVRMANAMLENVRESYEGDRKK